MRKLPNTVEMAALDMEPWFQNSDCGLHCDCHHVKITSQACYLDIWTRLTVLFQYSVFEIIGFSNIEITHKAS